MRDWHCFSGARVLEKPSLYKCLEVLRICVDGLVPPSARLPLLKGLAADGSISKKSRT